MNLLNGERVVLLSTNCSLELAQKIADNLELPLSSRVCGRFNDGEVQVQIGMDVPLRNSWIFIIGSTPPPMESWGEVWLLADAAKRAGAKQVVWVVPYIGYGRQDRKMEGHDPISSKTLLNLTVAAGVQQIIGVDLHCGQAQGFIDIPFSNLWGRKLVLQRILEILGIHYGRKEDENLLSELALAGPDPGAYKLTWHYAGKFNCILVGALKTRPEPGKFEMVLVAGDKAAGRDVIMLDDMSDTCGTLIEMGDLLTGKGARRIIAGFTHAVLSGNAIGKLNASKIERIVTTDTLPLKQQSDKIEVVSVAGELAQAIECVVTGKSVSSLAKQL